VGQADTKPYAYRDEDGDEESRKDNPAALCPVRET
jgi:hypothetical protein